MESSISNQTSRDQEDQETYEHYSNESIKIVVESLFRETTRGGRHTKGLVYLVLTSKILLLTSLHSFGSSTNTFRQDCENIFEVRTLFPLNSINLSIFKKSRKQILKLSYCDHCNRYFELEQSPDRNHLWALWCKHVLLLSSYTLKKHRCKYEANTTGYDLKIYNTQWEPQLFFWHDKHLYLGSKREMEDNSRPTPLPGLGPAEDVKQLLCLKPQYFGCWDQSEHWVQCESSKMLQ